jgi:hypothetical protein
VAVAKITFKGSLSSKGKGSNTSAKTGYTEVKYSPPKVYNKCDKS